MPDPSGIVVELESGHCLQADHCKLATGWNEVGVPSDLKGVTTHPGWHGNPWATDRFDKIPLGAPVLLVGTGLTASDTFAVLTARGHQGPVLSLSRRGLRPASQNPHRSTRSIWDHVLDTEPAVLRQLGTSASLRNTLRLLRQRIAETDRNTSSWHVAFDEFRDAARILWNQWSIAEQRQYGRHLKSWYDAFRFRNPPQTEAIVRAGIEQGRLEFTAGRLGSARSSANRLVLAFEARRDGRVCQDHPASKS
ncbi:MAG: hypothetical protein ABIN37_05170 [Burkholderiaceae bacterium]